MINWEGSGVCGDAGREGSTRALGLIKENRRVIDTAWVHDSTSVGPNHKFRCPKGGESLQGEMCNIILAIELKLSDKDLHFLGDVKVTMVSLFAHKAFSGDGTLSPTVGPQLCLQTAK